MKYNVLCLLTLAIILISGCFGPNPKIQILLGQLEPTSIVVANERHYERNLSAGDISIFQNGVKVNEDPCPDYNSVSYLSFCRIHLKYCKGPLNIIAAGPNYDGQTISKSSPYILASEDMDCNKIFPSNYSEDIILNDSKKRVLQNFGQVFKDIKFTEISTQRGYGGFGKLKYEAHYFINNTFIDLSGTKRYPTINYNITFPLHEIILYYIGNELSEFPSEINCSNHVNCPPFKINTSMEALKILNEKCNINPSTVDFRIVNSYGTTYNVVNESKFLWEFTDTICGRHCVLNWKLYMDPNSAELLVLDVDKHFFSCPAIKGVDINFNKI